MYRSICKMSQTSKAISLSLLLTVSLVSGQNLSSIVSPSGSPGDLTDRILHFSEVGTGHTRNRALQCLTVDTANVVWEGPNGTPIAEGTGTATGNQLFMDVNIVKAGGVVLRRGPNYLSPDGEYCCVHTTTNERRCVSLTACPTLNSLNLGTVTYNAVTNTATTSCVERHAPPRKEIICNEDAMTWNADQSPCIRTCPGELTLINGIISYQYPVDLIGEVTNEMNYVGTVATHTCDTGYELMGGPSPRTCQLIGGVSGWSGTTIMCQLINCGPPPPISNGSPGTPTSTTFGGTVTYSCDTGYQLSRSATVTCEANGVWSTLPTCTGLALTIIPSVPPKAGGSFSLICSVIVPHDQSLQGIISYQWLRGQSMLASTAELSFDSLYLSDAGQYRCEITVRSQEFNDQVTLVAEYDLQFQTLIIQIRFNVYSNCGNYLQADTAAKSTDITDQISLGVESLCSCGFSTSLLMTPFIRCFPMSSPQHVTYRAILTATANTSTVELASVMGQWVGDAQTLLIQSARFDLDNSCPLVIADENSSECPSDITNRTTPASPLASVDAIVGGVVGGTVALTVVVVIVAILLARRGKSGSNDIDTNETSGPAQVSEVALNESAVALSESAVALSEPSSTEPEYEALFQVDLPHPSGDFQITSCAAYAPKTAA